MQDTTIVLQAGGRSSRMGRDKALVPFQGQTLIEYILEQLRAIEAPVIVITNRPEDYTFLRLPLFGDLVQDWGALGGLHAALSHARTEFALVLACDMPFINLDYLTYTHRLAAGFDAVVPVLGEQQFAEPFRAIYRRSCLGAVERAIAAGSRRMISFLDEVRVRFVTSEEVRQFDPELVSFFNVNTPEDLASAARIAAGRGDSNTSKGPDQKTP